MLPYNGATGLAGRVVSPLGTIGIWLALLLFTDRPHGYILCWASEAIPNRAGESRGGCKSNI